MSDTFAVARQVARNFQNQLDRCAIRTQEHNSEFLQRPGITNITWTSPVFRRAHLSMFDLAASRGVVMLHCCVYPDLDNPAPIFGFDIIAGKSKITGCFMDYSPTLDPAHPLISTLASATSAYQWNRRRELPAWAQAIFSPYIVAAGNISDEQEIPQVQELAGLLMREYLTGITEYSTMQEDASEAHNLYARKQKENPQLRNSAIMSAAGLTPEETEIFINQILFPEL